MTRIRALAAASLAVALTLAGPGDAARAQTEAPTSVADAWTPLPVGTFSADRSWHTATLLDDGRVLIAGGQDSAQRTLRSAEIFDPASATSIPAGNMRQARAGHAAALLGDGRVVLVAGADDPNVARAETYDPATGVFSRAGRFRLPGPLREPDRSRMTALSLPDGRVLLAGGGQGERVHIFDPATDAFEAVETPQEAGRLALLLGDGRVLIVDGSSIAPLDGQPSGRALILDPESGTIVEEFSIDARYGAVLALLPDDRVLLVGGLGTEREAAILDLGTRSLTPAGSLSTERTEHTLTTLDDGTVLVTGGIRFLRPDSDPMPSAERFDPAASTFAPAGPMALGRAGHTATLLADGRVLVVGGTLDPRGLAELPDPAAELFAPGDDPTGDATP